SRLTLSASQPVAACPSTVALHPNWTPRENNCPAVDNQFRRRPSDELTTPARSFRSEWKMKTRFGCAHAAIPRPGAPSIDTRTGTCAVVAPVPTASFRGCDECQTPDMAPRTSARRLGPLLYGPVVRLTARS